MFKGKEQQEVIRKSLFHRDMSVFLLKQKTVCAGLLFHLMNKMLKFCFEIEKLTELDQ